MLATIEALVTSPGWTASRKVRSGCSAGRANAAKASEDAVRMLLRRAEGRLRELLRPSLGKDRRADS